MIRELICYRCVCSKCGHQWNTKTHDLPWNCAKCKSKLWNDDYTGGFAEPVAPVVVPQPVATPVAMNDAMARFLASAQPVAAEVIDDDWRFILKEQPQFDEQTARVYRKQVLYPAGKRVRTVQVDEDDHEHIIRVM